MINRNGGHVKKLCMVVAALAIFVAAVHARQVGTAPANPDSWCTAGGAGHVATGQTGKEVCVDWNGNLTPTTNNDVTSGTSSTRWSDVETVNINSGGGALTIGGALTVTGGITASGQTGLLVQTTTQLAAAAGTPAAIGSIGVAKIVNVDGTTNGYALCMATSTTVQSGTLANDTDWVYVSTKTTANIGKACF